MAWLDRVGVADERSPLTSPLIIQNLQPCMDYGSLLPHPRAGPCSRTGSAHLGLTAWSFYGNGAEIYWAFGSTLERDWAAALLGGRLNEGYCARNRMKAFPKIPIQSGESTSLVCNCAGTAARGRDNGTVSSSGTRSRRPCTCLGRQGLHPCTGDSCLGRVRVILDDLLENDAGGSSIPHFLKCLPLLEKGAHFLV